jgi:hypothetical protein
MSMTMSVAMTITLVIVPMAMSATFIPAFMAAIVVPVVTVPVLVAITDNHLVPAATVTGIPFSVIGIITPWVGTVNHYFVPVVNIVIPASFGQISPVYPYTIVKVNILVNRDIIINSYIWHIIIINVIIAHRPPFRLSANIYSYT